MSPVDPSESDRTAAADWGATTHFGYRGWALAALGDDRQVYARSTSSEQRELVFLPEGEAERFRAAALSGELVCPVPGCPSPLLFTRGPSERRHHFVHRQAPPDLDHQRSYVRRVATELIAAWIGAAHPRSRVEVDVTVAGLAVLALVTGPSGRRLAVMFVDRRLGAEAWWHADDKLRREGLVCSWIFAPRQFLRFPQPSLDAPPDDPAVRDRERGDIVLDRAVFREMRGAGQWPLLFNIATRELANLLVPGGVLAGRLALPPPASPERVLHLLPAALDECRLSRDGIATPAVNAEVLAAPRLARERRQALVRPPPRPFSEPPALAVTAAAREPIVSRPAVSAPAVSVAARRSMRARLVAALNADGQVTTLASVIARLGSFEEADEQLVRELLDDLRAEGVVDFVSPLGRFSAIHRRSAASPGGR